MSKLPNLRDFGLVLGGALLGACLFSVPKQASSAFREGDTIAGAIIVENDRTNRMERRPDNSEGWGEITRYSSYYRPSRVSSRLFPNHADCAAAKLDVWLNSGLVTYSHFSDADAAPAENTDVPGKTAMLIGGKECQIRIVVERADGRIGAE